MDATSNVTVHTAESNKSAVTHHAAGLMRILFAKAYDAVTCSRPSIIGEELTSAWTCKAV